MNPRRLPLAIGFAFGLVLAGGLRAQTPAAPPPSAAPPPQMMPVRFPALPLASPICTNIQRVGLTDITIIYSRPSMRGHPTIFGGIVPYNDLWRTGDNASTKISFSTPVRLGGAGRRGNTRRNLRPLHHPGRKDLDGDPEQGLGPFGARTFMIPRRTWRASKSRR